MKSAEPEQRLLAAIVSVAIRDTMHTPFGKKDLRLQSETASAFDFLLTEASDGYFELLNIDPEHYRRKLLEVMNDTSHTDVPFRAIDRRTFRINYKLWKREYDRLGGRVSRDAEDDSVDARGDAEEEFA